MEKIIGGKLAADALIERGVKYIFSISGGHITPIYQFLENSGVKIFATRHEQAAVFMAEAMARMTRKPAVAMVTAGPGFTNALSGIASARLSNAPVILIAGCVGLETTEKLDLQDMTQLPVIQPMVKKALVCHNAERVPEFIDMAFRYAANGRPGPVYLELPCDMLNAAADMTKVRKYGSEVTARMVDTAGAARIVDMLSQAKKPIVIAGSGAWYSDAGDELVAFVEKTGIPAFTLGGGRGVIPDTHPLCFESSLAIRPGASFVANVQSDLVLFLGSRLSLFYIFGDIFPKTAKFIQVDIEAEEIGRNRAVDLGVVSDIKAMLAELVRVVDERKAGPKLAKQYAEWVETVRAADVAGKAQAKPNWEKEGAPIHPLRLAREINDFMDREDDIVAADGGDTATWMGMTRTVRKAGHYLDYGLYGCLAVGLPYANAAKLLYPDKRVLVVIGDGSVGFNFMEFHTAIRNNLPIVAVVANDTLWGMIAHSQQLRLGHAIKDGTELGLVRYDKMVEALGGFGAFVEKPEDIRPAIEAAFKSGKTACINVMVDPSTISPGSVALANLGGYKA
ncbi:MAG TPA: thiamine pyrophosphate-binding protein [Spirochaetota bacterium]|nr:thiamine pyrophosphate-binding protein [Spirochaetota bacterium]HOD14388.1 thiamine pyrophosphate-binding protein [Spirochaetota bacterium]HPG50995.1 thiamine pyrophosphate-binding protein [Spirochaetota bacterium]HPN11748.1 thiamine pyrophosphate-binding protein [Spirochaetota bacterium]HQL81914.1 thiamine pyrophosphate-binding protein [Spirochaetota bacterium]